MRISDWSSDVCSSDLLGRFKHENAALTQTSDGHAVVYMGDDERGEFIYKFVSRDKIDHKKPKANRNLLDHGTLYVARFDAGDANPDHPKGMGQWIELTHGKNGDRKSTRLNSSH